MGNQEKSKSGEPIFSYEDKENKEFEFVVGNEESIELIENHIEKHIGKIETVFHEIVSNFIHIDIHWVKPNEKFPFHTFITSGMSEKPMNVPDEYDESKYSELCILIPSNWNIIDESFKLLSEVFPDESSYWPIRWLKFLARFPHEYNTWLGWGHTIPNGENAEPFAENTKLGCMLLIPALNFPIEFYELKINDNKTIRFFCLYPIYKEEMEFKLTKGTNALLDKFDKYNISSIIDLNRTNTCSKKGLFGLW